MMLGRVHWRAFFALIIIGSLGLFSLFGYYATRVSRPSVLFILLDAARSDHISSYGYDKITTPHIDAIRSTGMLFRNHFSDAQWTRPSLARLFSSRELVSDTLLLSGIDSIWGERFFLPKDAMLDIDPGLITLPEMMSVSGYETAMFSNSLVVQRGGYLYSKFGQAFSTRNKPSKSFVDKEESLAKELISWIAEPRENPYFAYWHIMLPHGPYPGAVSQEQFLGGVNKDVVARVREEASNLPVERSYSEEDLSALRGLYDSNLYFGDRLIGMVYDQLRESPASEDTIIVITSDHGESLGQHSILTHPGPPFESLIRVPLIVSAPGRISPGSEFLGLSKGIDVMPTLASLMAVNVPVEKTIDGRNILKPALSSAQEDIVYGEDWIRTARYKYILGLDFLFDVKADPQEQSNLRLVLPEQTASLRGNIERHLTETREKSSDGWRRKQPWKEPFWFLIGDMALDPEAQVKRFGDIKGVALDAEIDKVWWLSPDLGGSKLSLLPNRQEGRISISSILPNDTYSIALLVGAADEIRVPVEALRLKTRFNLTGDFLVPKGIKLFRKIQQHYYYYLDLGVVEIADSLFSLDIEASPVSDGASYFFRSLLFTPSAALGRSHHQEGRDEEDVQSNVRRLKSLGYL